MDALVLSIMEVVQELLRDTRGVLVGLAVIVVSVLGLMVGRSLSRGFFNVAAPDDEPAQPKQDRDTENLVTPGRQIRSGDTVTGKVAAIRWMLRAIGLAGLVAVGSLVALENYGTEPILRWSLAKLEPKSGVRVTFEKATGGLLSGRFVLHQVRAVRENHPESNFDLKCSQVTARCSLWKILSPNLAFDGLRIEQVSGSYQRSPGPRKGPRPEGVPAELPRNAGNVRIGQLQLLEATITYTDSTVEGEPVRIGLAIDSLDCAPVRAAHAPFDLMFRSNAAGTIEGRPFLIQTTHSATGTKTEWRATGLPIALIRAYLEGPFRWLQSGECDVSIVQEMPLDRTLPVILETHLILRDIRPGVPADTKPAAAIALQLLISKMKNFPKEKDVAFTLKLDPEKFDLTKTEDRAQLWKQFKTAAVAALLQSGPVQIEGLPDEANAQLDRTIDNVTNKALKAIENIRIRRQARKAAKQQGKPVPPSPEPQP
ncbi:MAG: hypothetical protein JWN70_3889 [Planctomycetaceae bacterium]|nr:hypothetical protein [Planctomycetaceae bacterium]